MQYLTARAFVYSLFIHLFIGALLIHGFDNAPSKTIKPKPQENIIAATTIDSTAIQQELKRIKEIEKKKKSDQLKKQKAAEKKLKATEKKAKAAEAQRKKKQKQLDSLKKKEVAIAAKKQKDERLKKEAAEKRRKQEEAAAKIKRIEEKKKKAKALAEKKRKEEERRKKAAEEALKKQLAAEQAAEQKRQDQKLLQSIIGNIYRKVTNNFNKTGLPKGLECILSVQTVPGGEVISVTLKRSSGNDIFDRRAITAVEKSSPLPMPAAVEAFNRLKLRSFNFRFRPEE